MAKRNDEVMQMVRKRIKKDPSVSNEVLKEQAEKIDPDIADLSSRQFHARYPLQVKRQLSRQKQNGQGSESKKKSSQSKSQQTELSREQVRAVLIDFARDLSDAGSKAEMIDLLAGLDSYVDRILDQ